MSVRIHAQLSGIRVSTTRVGTLDVAAAEPISFDVFFDYACPYVYRASVLLDAVRRPGGRNLDVRWRYFSLTQVNTKDDGWTVWEAPPSELVRGRLAFAGSEAARRQDRFEVFHRALLEARHVDRREIDDREVIDGVAEKAGLDLERFAADLADPTILETLAADHREAVTRFGVFGTPTFVFDDGASAYVRLSEPVGAEGAVDVFDRLLSVAASEPRILEIKRPRKPA
jgi:predicted DsbA family dithiol-disulfide isomerase